MSVFVYRTSLEEGDLAFIDSTQHFLADIPAYYRGLSLLRTHRAPSPQSAEAATTAAAAAAAAAAGAATTVQFEVSADCVVFVAIPRETKKTPAASHHLGYQPLVFASIDNTISVYTAASRDVSSTQHHEVYRQLVVSPTHTGFIFFLFFSSLLLAPPSFHSG